MKTFTVVLYFALKPKSLKATLKLIGLTENFIVYIIIKTSDLQLELKTQGKF